MNSHDRGITPNDKGGRGKSLGMRLNLHFTSASSFVGTVVTPETDTLANSSCSSSKSNW